MLKLTKNKKISISIFALLCITYIVLLILPANYFDEGDSICVSVVLFDVECYGCGLTRAIQHLIHFEFQEAWEYNKLAFIIFPFAIAVILYELILMYRKQN